MLKGVVAAERVPEMCCWYQRSGRTDEIVPANARPGSAVIRQVLASSNCCLAARGRVLKQTYRLAILQPSQRDAMFLGHLGEMCFHNIAIEVVHLTKGQTEFFRLAVLNLGITIVHDICCGYQV